MQTGEARLVAGLELHAHIRRHRPAPDPAKRRPRCQALGTTHRKMCAARVWRVDQGGSGGGAVGCMVWAGVVDEAAWSSVSRFRLAALSGTPDPGGAAALRMRRSTGSPMLVPLRRGHGGLLVLGNVGSSRPA